MSRPPTPPEAPAAAHPLLVMPARIGARITAALRTLVYFAGAAAAVLFQGLRPLTWRRTIRREFMRQCHQTGVRTLPFTLLVGALVGMGGVFQTIYWFELFGQSEVIGRFLTLVLGREIAPVLVGLIFLGRSGSVMIVALAGSRIDGRVHTLDAQGIDPFLYMVVPRVLASAGACFCLNVLFIAVALVCGFVMGNALGVTAITLYDYVDMLLMAMGPADFIAIPLKSFSIGFAVALISCLTGLAADGTPAAPHKLIPSGFARSFVSILLISAFFSIVL